MSDNSHHTPGCKVLLKSRMLCTMSDDLCAVPCFAMLCTLAHDLQSMSVAATFAHARGGGDSI